MIQLLQLKKELKNLLSEKRFHHTEGVASSAKWLAKKYGANPKQAELAGWVHDCAKEMSLSDMQKLIRKANMDVDEPVWHSRALLHGPAGSAYAQMHFGIENVDVLNAVFFHTTGKPDMSLLEKVVFLADYIEPSRSFPGVDALRDLAHKDLTEALIAAYDFTIGHLAEEHAYIYDLTLAGRNYLVLSQIKYHEKDAN